VFPRSVMVSLPPAILASLLVPLHGTQPMQSFADREDVEERVFTNSAVWQGFTFLVGFMVVFRTSHAYNRFWEACASVRKMGSEWFDSCSALVAFSRVSTSDPADVLAFQNKVIRLFSMLHAVALAELEDLDNGMDDLGVRSFKMELVDAGSFDDETLQTVRDSTCRVELLYQWIQSLVVEAMEGKVLQTPPPILTRSFHELSNGMVSFHDAMKVADTPFPFPYSQTCDALLFAQYITAPFVVSAYVPSWYLAGFFCFIVIFTFACLTLTGLELEFPYGRDANDIQGNELQLEMNHKLRLLVSRAGWQRPALRESELQDTSSSRAQKQAVLMRKINEDASHGRRSFSDLWDMIPQSSPSSTRRFEVAHGGNSQPMTSMIGATPEVAEKAKLDKKASKSSSFLAGVDTNKHRANGNRKRNRTQQGPAASSYVVDNMPDDQSDDFSLLPPELRSSLGRSSTEPPAQPATPSKDRGALWLASESPPPLGLEQISAVSNI